MSKRIAKVVVGLPIDYSFDYLIPEKFIGKVKVGCRVWVPFTNKKLVGYVIDLVEESRFKKIKSIISLIDDEPILGKIDLRFLKDFSEYYCCSLSEAIETSLPPVLKGGAALALKRNSGNKKERNISQVLLIHDIADKRWEIFCKRIQNCLNLDGGVIFLVPEISCIAPALKKFKEYFPQEDISVFNRQQKKSLQIIEWQKAKDGNSKIVIGTRSAIFAHLKSLELIIIDEEDSSSYKQEQMPFYHARDVALMRLRATNASLILASATPSLEAYQLVKKNKFEFITSDDSRKKSEVSVIDMTRFSYEHRRKNTILSFPLEDSIRRVLSENGKVILFINRKGFSNVVRCRKCKFTLKCKRCNVSLTYHFDKKKLICRFCNYKIDPPELCPECRESYMRYSGMGTEKLESEISRLFPDKKILRIDRETGVKNDKFDILIATQIILKSYSLVSADLVGVVGIDYSLNRMDFRAAEKTFSLLVKLSLLANRKTIVQTYNSSHYSVFSAAQRDFPNFYKQELSMRRSLGFPPFGHFISLMLRGKTLDSVKNLSFFLFENLNKANKTKGMEISEPAPDIPDKLRGSFRWHILLKGKGVKKINSLIKKCLNKLKKKSGIIISINVDI